MLDVIAGFAASGFGFRQRGSPIAEQLGLLSLVLCIRDSSGIFGLLQVNQLLSNGWGLGFGYRVRSKLQAQTSGKEGHG
jgi:hypothetical protein